MSDPSLSDPVVTETSVSVDGDTVYTSGDGVPTVSITAPASTLNWSLVALFLLGAFWLYTSLDGSDDED